MLAAKYLGTMASSDNKGTDESKETEALLGKRTPSRAGCWSRLRHSKNLVVIVVFGAMMLDLMIMTSIDPILPSVLTRMYGIRRKNALLNSTHFNNYTTPGGALFANNVTALNTTTDDDSNSTIHVDDPHTHVAADVGVIVALKPATEILSNLIVGFVVERVGHRYPMILGFFFNTFATLGFAFAPSFSLLLLARICQAISSSLSVVSGLALIASTFTDDESRSKATSLSFAGLSLGIVLGYPFGTTAYQFFGREAPFLLLAGLCVMDGLLRMIISAPEVSKPTHSETSTSIKKFFAILCDPYVFLVLSINFAPNFGLGVFLATGPAWMLDALDAQLWQIGVVITIAMVWQISAQTITGAFGVRFGRWKFCMVGLWCFACGMGFYPMCTQIWHVIGPEISVRIGHGIIICVVSPMLCWLVDIRHNSEYGLIYGLYTASYNSGLMLGPIVGGNLLHVMTFKWLYRAVGIYLYLLSVFVVFLKNPPPRNKSLKSAPSEDSVTDNSATPAAYEAITT
ncbi:synaptic vesicular amine transporter-like [Tubulanus polymorphus]|uniref:synaptic vesicular amine transporter-like n=1 Tax=Tubulanus polymorphus TaxID=672921 RepID=UPI003DA1E850